MNKRPIKLRTKNSRTMWRRPLTSWRLRNHRRILLVRERFNKDSDRGCRIRVIAEYDIGIPADLDEGLKRAAHHCFSHELTTFGGENSAGEDVAVFFGVEVKGIAEGTEGADPTFHIGMTPPRRSFVLDVGVWELVYERLGRLLGLSFLQRVVVGAMDAYQVIRLGAARRTMAGRRNLAD